MEKLANLFQGERGYYSHNACVGNNGSVNYHHYIDGYQGATLVMLESVLSEKNIPEDADYWCIDTAIYPILFSARHYLELYIKKAINDINSFKVQMEIEGKLIRTHDLNSLWKLFKEVVTKTRDLRFCESINNIEPYINDFAKIDLTGETFRYPYNQDYSKKHLEDISVIGLNNFYTKFKKLSNYLINLSNCIDFLSIEYATCTFTKTLNRSDIENIAKQLPTYSEWSDKDKFSQLKNNIKEQFKIGSKELSEAIEIIKNHIEFKKIIYPDTYDLPINKEKLIKFIRGCFSVNDLTEFTDNDIACLTSLVETGNETTYYSEYYLKFYEENIKNIKEEDYQKKYDFECCIRNTEKIKKGLKKIGYSSILD